MSLRDYLQQGADLTGSAIELVDAVTGKPNPVAGTGASAPGAAIEAGPTTKWALIVAGVVVVVVVLLLVLRK